MRLWIKKREFYKYFIYVIFFRTVKLTNRGMRGTLWYTRYVAGSVPDERWYYYWRKSLSVRFLGYVKIVLCHSILRIFRDYSDHRIYLYFIQYIIHDNHFIQKHSTTAVTLSWTLRSNTHWCNWNVFNAFI